VSAKQNALTVQRAVYIFAQDSLIEPACCNLHCTGSSKTDLGENPTLAQAKGAREDEGGREAENSGGGGEGGGGVRKKGVKKRRQGMRTEEGHTSDQCWTSEFTGKLARPRKSNETLKDGNEVNSWIRRDQRERREKKEKGGGGARNTR
jgi:hypothetical protein